MATPRIDKEQVKRIMQGLRCSEDEATEIFLSDKAIDRGERMPFDLPPELEKGSQENGKRYHPQDQSTHRLQF